MRPLAPRGVPTSDGRGETKADGSSKQRTGGKRQGRNTTHRGRDIIFENETNELPKGVAARCRVASREECELLKRPRRQLRVLWPGSARCGAARADAEETAAAAAAAAAARSLLHAHRRTGGVLEAQPRRGERNLRPGFGDLNDLLSRGSWLDNDFHRLVALEAALRSDVDLRISGMRRRGEHRRHVEALYDAPQLDAVEEANDIVNDVRGSESNCEQDSRGM